MGGMEWKETSKVMRSGRQKEEAVPFLKIIPFLKR
jgi:hypothetical protein